MKFISGRGVFVTGGAQGIGAAISRAFLAKGDRVLIVDRDEDSGMALTREYGEQVRFRRGDVRDDVSMALAIEELVAFAGSIDVAVNNAGVAGPHKVLPEFTGEEYELIMDVNVRGIFNVMRHELRAMQKASAGVVINMASAIGLVGAANQSVYSASKHAVVGLTRSAALDFGNTGIRINCVCPGVIESDLSRDAMAANPGLAEVWKGLHPMGRLGRATEVAQAVLWLAGDQSSFVTGACLPVDGGYTSR